MSLLIERDNGVVTLTLARPDRHNAIDLALCRALRDAVAELTERGDARGVVLAAQGRSFSVGGDIREFAAHAADIGSHLEAMTDALHAAVLGLRKLRAPVIAAVNGVAAGGGFGLVLACDLAIAARSARFVSAYTRIGLTPDTGVSHFLRRRLGEARAFELVATNRELAADEAAQLGLIMRVVDDAALASEARALARSLADAPANAVGAAKALLVADDLPLLEAQLAREAAGVAAIAAHPEARAKLAAF